MAVVPPTPDRKRLPTDTDDGLLLIIIGPLRPLAPAAFIRE